MFVPEIKYSSDRYIFTSNQEDQKEENIYNYSVRQAVHGKTPKSRKILTPSYSPPTHKPFAISNSNSQDAYENPLSNSPFHNKLSYGSYIGLALLTKKPFASETDIDIIYKPTHSPTSWYNLKLTKWSKTEATKLAAIQTQSSLVSGSVVTANVSIKVFDITRTSSPVYDQDYPSSDLAPVTAWAVEWRDAHNLWVGDREGELSTCDIRSPSGFKVVSTFPSLNKITNLSQCGNLLAVGFNSNSLNVVDIRKPEKSLKSYMFKSAVLGLKFVNPKLLIAGGGNRDQTVRLFDPTDSGDLNPYHTIERLGQVTSIEYVRSQIIIGGGLGSNKSVYFYRNRGKWIKPTRLYSLQQQPEERSVQVALNRSGQKLFVYLIDGKGGRIEEVTVPQVLHKKPKKNERVFSSIDIR